MWEIPVGIVKDFDNESLHAPLKPCIIQASTTTAFGSMLIRVKPNAQKQALPAIYKRCLATVIALLTISFQSVKAALTNPVKSLRSE